MCVCQMFLEIMSTSHIQRHHPDHISVFRYIPFKETPNALSAYAKWRRCPVLAVLCLRRAYYDSRVKATL